MSDTASRLPLTPEDITAEWLSHVLAVENPGVEVETIKQTDIMWGTGTKVFVTARYNTAGKAAGLPNRLCIKAGLAAHREAMLFLYRLEARFFGEIAPQLDIEVPRCLFAAHDDQQGVVILEDLRSANAEILRVQRPLSQPEASAFLDGLAALHARWWNASEVADDGELGWLDRHDPLPDGPDGDYGRGQLEPGTFAHYMELPRAVGMPKALKDRDAMSDALQMLRRFPDDGLTCVIHADAHLGNMFITADGKPGFLDWQSVRRGHWAQDVAYFMISALDPLDRRLWERDLIKGYLSALNEKGVQGAPSEGEAWKAIRVHICYGLFYWAVNPVEWQVEENNAAVVPRFAWAAVDHNAPPLFGPLLGPLSG